MRSASSWQRHDDALALLEHGSPFERRAYRDAVVAAVAGWREASVGARLPDGTTAAVALLARRRRADGVPWGVGAVRSSRPLTSAELRTFLAHVRRASHCVSVEVRQVRLPGTASYGAAGAETHVLPLSPDLDEVRSRWHGKGEQALRRAARAGGQARASQRPDAFLRLYGAASSEWRNQYPHDLIRRLLASGDAIVIEVTLTSAPDVVVGAALGLRGADRWVYWLAAADDAGRRAEAGYLAVSELALTAAREGAPFLDLGGSQAAGEDLPGVRRLKERMGGEPTAVEVLSTRGALAPVVELAETAARRAVRAARRPTST
ncbi:MAG TPA: GNAT family N-acetyltransferase [Mycobacteriales bacterium]|nr:GNAT family N-acetyltransferase [Mycobacteriales bacterium]